MGSVQQSIPFRLDRYIVDSAYAGHDDLARRFAARHFDHLKTVGTYAYRSVTREAYLGLLEKTFQARDIADPEGARALYTELQELEASYRGTGDALYATLEAATGAAMVRAGFADRGTTVARTSHSPFRGDVVVVLIDTDKIDLARGFVPNAIIAYSPEVGMRVAAAYANAGYTDDAVSTLLAVRNGPYGDIVARIKALAGRRFDSAVARSVSERGDWEKKLEFALRQAASLGKPISREEYLAENPPPAFFGGGKENATEWFHAVAQAGAHPSAIEAALLHYRDNTSLRLAALAGHHGVPLAW